MEIDEREPVSCRLVVSKTNGDVLAFCHQEKDGCGMRGEPQNYQIMNLFDLFDSVFSAHSQHLWRC